MPALCTLQKGWDAPSFQETIPLTYSYMGIIPPAAPTQQQRFISHKVSKVCTPYTSPLNTEWRPLTLASEREPSWISFLPPPQIKNYSSQDGGKAFSLVACKLSVSRPKYKPEEVCRIHVSYRLIFFEALPWHCLISKELAVGAAFIAGSAFTKPWQKILLPQYNDESAEFHPC